ncbi:protein turtle homolog A isoform X2 [Synchiropus splendidus]|uniref:protein turtle homolog A isoform X2 n=1 Tax=Synchiropus splendidus TaxID=270530 RepID=UPI00237DA6FF|nr:protein turtle homolog A isoform X2 [Synchiropus splendidus]XP_053706385.1 protein turtle homolog A isoform X2 [Synchiropus splendidus]
MGSSESNRQSVTLLAAFCLLSVISEGAEVRGTIGDAVQLECSLRAPELKHVVEWVREGLDNPVLMKFGSHAPRVHPKYEGRVSLVKNANLRLEALQLEDQGLYQCQILRLDKSTDEPQNSTWIRLSVTAPPTFSKAPPPAIEGVVGSDLSLECEATGNPPPTISWSKDGSIIDSRPENGVLLLKAVNMQSAGQYSCQASNSEGSTTAVTKVKIKGPPVILIPPRNTSLNISQDAQLQCQAVADPPNMTYVWQKERENVYHRESLKSRVKILVDGTLLISRLTPEDSGNYTCMPTNGLMTPPTASAILTVMHPAQASGMPEETYLPAGMDGRIHCPAVAQPPLLRVLWTKDGEPLDLSMYPGWSVTSKGSLIMATVNDDAEGIYTCTPYNSYGSMGPSGPTKVILQDPPTFRTPPKKEYREEAGRTLLITCQGSQDPTTKISWIKVDVNRPVSYSIEQNGSLLLQPLMKEHHGLWECSAANRVASVKSSTQVLVLGTSPHAATSLSVSPGVRQANISWVAGFDGGSAQTFSVWVKKISESGDNDEKPEWFSVPALQSTKLLVTGLSPSTVYQFSVLSQNKMGTGPFSEIASLRTLDNPMKISKLKPPTSLTASMSAAGVVLQWSPPPALHPPVTGFLLQTRTIQGEWFNVDEDISANTSEIIVPGLHKDSVYELRLLSRCGELLSEPSPSVNVSTMGIEMNPSTSRLLEFVPEPLLAGVLGGVGFMCLALFLLLGSACIINHKRDRRRKKKDDTPRVIYNCSPSMKTSGFGSADSVLKKSLLPASPLYPTISSTASSSTSSKTDCSSFSAEDCHQRKNHQLKHSHGCLSRTSSTPLSPSVELISRGPDGRFVLPPYEDTLSIHRKKSASIRRSISVSSEWREQKDLPFVLSVDLPPCKSTGKHSTSQADQVSLRQSCCSPDFSEQRDDYTSINSMRSSLSNFPPKAPEFAPSFPVLPHIRSGFGQQSTTASALVLQMEHERERGNLSRCLKLAQEREELERELQRLNLHHGAEREINEEAESGEDEVRRPVWEYKSSTLPQRYQPCTNETTFSSPAVPWDASAHVSSPSVIPVRTTSSPTRVHPGKHQRAPAFIKQTPLRSEEAHSFSKDTLTLPRVSSKHPRHESEEAVLHDNSQQSTSSEMQTSDSCTEVWRQNYAYGDSNSALCFHDSASTGRPKSALDTVSGTLDGETPGQNSDEVFVEMSVDEPEFEELQPNKHMLHQRIASHVQHGHPLSRRGHFKDVKRSKSCHSDAPVSVDCSLLRDVGRGVCGAYDSKHRSHSLDLRRKKGQHFLTPDAWIDSLNQACARSVCHLDNAYMESQRFSTPSNAKVICSPNEDDQSLMGSMERPTEIPEVCSYQLPREAFIVPNPAKSALHQNKAICYLEDTEESARSLLEDNVLNSEQKALQVEEGGYDVAESGSSYSSYASSGRGSMAPTNGRLSICNLPTSSTSSPVTVEESQQNTEDKYRHQAQQSQRKRSVDENYEWDDTDSLAQSKDAKDGLLPLLNLQKSTLCSSLPSMPFSTKALENCSRFSILPGHQSSRSAEPELDTVLF